MNSAIRTKLSVMMFVEYVIWGAWLPLLGLYLGKDYLNFGGFQQAMVFNALAIATLTGMFFGGQVADRYFAQEKFLGFSHLLGGLSMLALAYQKSFWPFFGLMLLYCVFYVPTLSVTNAIAFANLKDAQKRFRIRQGLGHDRLDRGKLAFDIHPDRLAKGFRRWRTPAGSSPGLARRWERSRRGPRWKRPLPARSPSPESPRLCWRPSASCCRTHLREE